MRRPAHGPTRRPATAGAWSRWSRRWSTTLRHCRARSAVRRPSLQASRRSCRTQRTHCCGRRRCGARSCTDGMPRRCLWRPSAARCVPTECGQAQPQIERAPGKRAPRYDRRLPLRQAPPRTPHIAQHARSPPSAHRPPLGTQVFAQLLKVPAPVTASHWAPAASRFGGAAGSPLRSSGLGLGLSSSGGGAGGGMGARGSGGGEGSPLLSSRYASMAAGL
jgi:hypothetical protein